MPFDLTTWRGETQQLVADFARDPRGTLARAGVDTLYGFLLGSTLLPVVAAYATDPGNTMVALSGVVGGLGANLIANIVQHRYVGPDAITVITQDAQSAELAPAFEAIAKQVEVIPRAEQALQHAGQLDVLNELRAELLRLGKAGQFAGASINVTQSGGINFGIGNSIQHTGDNITGDKVMGDKFTGNKYVGPTDPTKGQS